MFTKSVLSGNHLIILEEKFINDDRYSIQFQLIHAIALVQIDQVHINQ